jgi:NADH-quinone oxidoreductase subunit M
MIGILTTTIFLPVIGALILLFLKKGNDRLVKITGFATTVLTFAVSLFLYSGFNPTADGFQFIEKAMWIQSFKISYHVGVDGLSLLLILLTTFLTPLALLGTWNSVKDRLKEYTIMILFLEVGMIGVFAALDLFLFYIFWEAMLIPMYFIIGIWGGPERVYAALKFFLYTLLGSLLMLVAILVLTLYAAGMTNGQVTTSIPEIYGLVRQMPGSMQMWLFLAFALSFSIKVPLWPLHTWLPDAHVQAPTAGSVLLAGVLLKMGTYGFLRFNIPLFTHASIQAAPYMCALAVIGIIFGALVAMVQTDIKKLVAYSSVSHLGFIMLGIFSFTEESTQGAIIQMVNHGLSTGALFLVVGMIYDRAHTRTISDFGGVAKIMPVYAAFVLIISLSSIGLPGLNGFVGEFLILVGTFQSRVLDAPAFAIVAAVGVILSAGYLLWMYNRVMFGPAREGGVYHGHVLTDINVREIVSLVPIVVFIVWIGVYPSTFMSLTGKVTKTTLQKVEYARSYSRPMHVAK